MTRLIDADVLKEKAHQESKGMSYPYREDFGLLVEWIVDKTPAVQPQITHCAECRHWKHSDVRKNYCEVFDWMNTAGDFCSFAERRTNG